jgi:hypothetical protein
MLSDDKSGTGEIVSLLVQSVDLPQHRNRR